MKKTYLILFAISPVQSYIEQARKTQDLYAGSFILSHLCRTAITASGISESQLIFPKFAFDKPPQSMSNRFLALVEKDILEGQEETALKTYGAEIQLAVEDTFMAIAKSAFPECQINYREQVAQYLTIHWAFLPFEEVQYAQKYEELEQLMGAIKHVRAFAQLPETGRKCSICGERNVKIYRKNENDGSDSDLTHKKLFTDDAYIVGYKRYGEFSPKMLQPGEGLCAVCFMKRGAETYFSALPEYNRNFPSTPDIALLDAKAIDQTIWQEKEYDGHVIFDWQEQGEKCLQNYSDLSDKEKKDSADIATILKEKMRISPYYALLCFDGDSMGKWLSGAYLKDGQREKLMDFHQTLSAKLMGFARLVREYFEQHREYGHVIYTGGDDFLGFVSLNSLFSVMKYLRTEFDKLDLREFADADNKLTFSAGAVIAHIKTPLSEVLKWARGMEKAAKLIDDNKDAFALAVLKHSGEIHQTVFKWREGDMWIPDVFEEMITQIRNGDFSDTFLKNIDKEFRRLLNPDGTLTDRHLLEPETKRLIERACQLERLVGEAKDDYIKRKKHAIDLFVNKMVTLYNASTSLENILFALGIIDFCVRRGTICKQLQ